MLTEAMLVAALWGVIMAAIASMLMLWVRLPVWPAAVVTFITVFLAVLMFGSKT